MNGFNPFDDGVSIEGIEKGKILLGIKGSQGYQSGEYTEEKNVMRTVPITASKSEEIDADLEHHAWALRDREKGNMVQRMETNPGKQVVAFDDAGRRHVLGSNPALYVEEE